jgi:hypothetical protein
LVFIIFASFKCSSCRLLLHLEDSSFRRRLATNHVYTAVLLRFKEIALIIVEIYLGYGFSERIANIGVIFAVIGIFL